MLNIIILHEQALGISIYTTVCVLWSFYQCDIDGVFHRWMAVSISLSILVVPLPTIFFDIREETDANIYFCMIIKGSEIKIISVECQNFAFI